MKRRKDRYQPGQTDEQPPVTPPEAEESGVYQRGQTVIPKAIREALSIEYGTRLHWEVREGVMHVMPLPKNPAQALRGALKGSGITWQWFMEQRQQERERERAAEERAWRTSSTPQR